MNTLDQPSIGTHPPALSILYLPSPPLSWTLCIRTLLRRLHTRVIVIIRQVFRGR